MTTLTQKMKAIKLGEQFVREIENWYVENDKQMPENWRMKDPEWWVEYKRKNEG